MRITITEDPFLPFNGAVSWQDRGYWPCSWVVCPGADEFPFVAAYRRRFHMEQPDTIRIHVSADERYMFYLDGQLVGRGPERGDPNNWYFETYDLHLTAGEHVLVALVWSLGPDKSPYAQLSVAPGFILATDYECIDVLCTGQAPWEAKRLSGLQFVDPFPAWGTGWNLDFDGRSFDWGWETGQGRGWQPVELRRPGAGRMSGWVWHKTHLLKPATLPPMLNELCHPGRVRFITVPPGPDTRPIAVRAANHVDDNLGWGRLVAGEGRVTIPPRTRRRIIVDLEDYYCVYPEIVTSGGAGSTIRLLWEEALRAEPDPECHDKGHRDEIEGKYFVGTGDTFHPDGGPSRRFFTLWWQAGRYYELYVETDKQPLIIEALNLYETRYPLALEARFASDDDRLQRIMPVLVRGMQMCAHETYLDCPYYEQLMYAGDTRLEILTNYVMTLDDRLPRKAMYIFDQSQQLYGLCQARYPNREFQIIPAWSLWWGAMIYDYARWRNDRAFVRERMPGVRATLDNFQLFTYADGLIAHAPGWNIFDWVPVWEGGVPPEGEDGGGGLLNWQYVRLLAITAELEDWLGEVELAARWRRLAAEHFARLEVYWDEARGLYADDKAHEHYSEHTQCLALLAGLLPAERHARVANGLLNAPDLQRTTIYMMHYLFEAYRAIGRIDKLFERLQLWFDQQAYGARTPLEMPEPSRSDCHAWGSHPLYHYFASILGIRPGSFGFETVEIAPQLGHLQQASGTLPHPLGAIVVDFRVEGGMLQGHVTLPDGLTGTLRYNQQVIALTGGPQTIEGDGAGL